MPSLRLTALVAAVGACGVLSAQNAPTRPPAADESPTKQSQSTTKDKSTTPGTANPMPSTTRTEGTAADRTVPGATPTRPADPGTVNPTPATSRTEGTAADRSPPGETPVRGTAAEQAPEKVTSQMGARSMMGQRARGSELIGLTVETPRGNSIGAVQDIVVERDGRVTYAIIADGDAGRALVAIPWKTFHSMMRDGKVIMDESRLAKAPRFEPGQWPDLGNQTWSADVDRYWKVRTATR